MKIGIHLGNNGPAASAESIGTLARTAEALGLDSVWVSDHVAIPTSITSTYPYGPPGSFNPEATKNFWEPFAVLAFVAGLTTRVELGTSVIVAPQRPPLLIAKQWATLDALSGGRTILGVGTGWMREEFEALGYGDLFERRGAALDEAISVMRDCWRAAGPVEHHGPVYDIRPVLMEPKPARAGGIPVWIGGHGKRAIRRAAEVGDGWQPLRIPTDELRPLLAYLDEQLVRYGRSRQDITLSIGLLAQPPGQGNAANEFELAGSAEQCATKLRAYRALGFEHIMLSMTRGAALSATVDAIQFVAREVRPHLEAT